MISFSNNVGKQNKNSIFQCHKNGEEENETLQIRLLIIKKRKRTTNAKQPPLQKKFDVEFGSQFPIPETVRRMGTHSRST